jgi:hypothetical protein
MIGCLPMSALTPLDYRYALDAAMAALPGGVTPLVLCDVPELASEVQQRLSSWIVNGPTMAALWANDWRTNLAWLVSRLPVGATLAVIASRPLARLLPERRAWAGNPLGLRRGGIRSFGQTLRRSGFRLEAYGIHSAHAIGLSLLSQQLTRWGKPDIGDRLHFAARQRYCTTGPLAALSTVALLIARKEHAG